MSDRFEKNTSISAISSTVIKRDTVVGPWLGGGWQAEYREKHNGNLHNWGCGMGGKDDNQGQQPEKGGAPWQEKLDV